MNLSKYISKFKNVSKTNLLVALTGGIGSGKSYVLSLFSKFGCYTISADEKVKKILTNKKNCDKILIRYPEVSDRFGFLDKKKLALLVFKNKRVKNFIEGFIHPKVISEILDEIKDIRGKVIVVEIPLLFESGLEGAFDVIINVSADTDIRIKRLIKRGMSKSDIMRRINSQEKEDLREKKADLIISNNSSLIELRKDVREIALSFKKIIN